MPVTNALSEHLAKMAAGFAVETASDAELVVHYVRDGDTRAFSTLVQRHGPMVWGVCRRILSNQQDAEDAFQATFLVLVKKAATIRPPSMMGNWLYGVAVRAVQKARTNRARREAKERQAATMRTNQTIDDAGTADLRLMLDAAIAKLPDKYRLPIVLCDLEGRTRDDVARELGWPAGSVAGRLARARELLARRLQKRGIGGTGAILVATLTEQASAATLPAHLVISTTQLATAAAATVSPHVSFLVKEIIQSMFLANLKTKLAIVALVVLTGLGTGGIAWALANPDEPKEKQTHQEKKEPQVKKMTDLEKLQGIWDITALEVDGNKVPADSMKGAAIELDGEKFITRSMGATYKGTCKLDSSKSPKTIDLVFEEGPERGNTNLGIYELNGDNWRICLDMAGKGRPTEFVTMPNSNCALETLTRRKAKAADNSEQAKKDMAFLEGDWTMVSGEKDGQAFPKEVTQSMKRVSVDGETTVTMAGQRFMRAKYTLDPSAKPNAIDYLMTDGPDIGKTMRGLYEIDGETVKFCFATVGADRPTEFKTKPGGATTMTVWKKKKT